MAYEYKVNGKTVALEVDPSVVAVRFHDEAPKSGRARASDAVARTHSFKSRFEVPGERLTLIPVPPAALGGIGPSAMMGKLDAQSEVARALPVFRVGQNQVVPTDRIMLAAHDAAELPALLQRHGLTLLEQDGARALARLAPDADVFAVCRALPEDPAVDYAEPDFVTIGRHIPSWMAGASVKPDPLTQDQYALVITGALQAQKLVTGDASIRIAILDEGVDTRHPDLEAAVVGTYDAIDRDSYQEPSSWDGHGTACAGLAAATGGNGVGIRGVAAGCSLLAVRIAHSERPGGPWIVSNNAIERAIQWSWRDGRADVLSSRWGGGPPSTAIARALEDARTRGRNGLGCVVVIAAGNEQEPVSFPATVPHMLAVGASNQFDEVKTRTSQDHETNWGSNFGPELSVAAPGVQNLTTDICGDAGYSTGDYAPRFNGTSSATPIVAGACALLLSARPDLREGEVRKLILATAAKIGPFPYADGRNDHAGYGRVDVLRAVQAALALPAGIQFEPAIA